MKNRLTILAICFIVLNGFSSESKNDVEQWRKDNAFSFKVFEEATRAEKGEKVNGIDSIEKAKELKALATVIIRQMSKSDLLEIQRKAASGYFEEKAGKAIADFAESEIKVIEFIDKQKYPFTKQTFIFAVRKKHGDAYKNVKDDVLFSVMTNKFPEYISRIDPISLQSSCTNSENGPIVNWDGNVPRSTARGYFGGHDSYDTKTRSWKLGFKNQDGSQDVYDSKSGSWKLGFQNPDGSQDIFDSDSGTWELGF